MQRFASRGGALLRLRASRGGALWRRALSTLKTGGESRRGKVVVIGGATGTHKSETAVALAQQLAQAHGTQCEIVSMDAVQVYKHVDIGGNAFRGDAQQGIPHHLEGQLELTEPVNVKDFIDDAHAATTEILERGRTPIVVGGTGFYVDAFLRGVRPTPPADAAVRKELQAAMEGGDWGVWLARLSEADPVYAASIQDNDWRRLSRALEIVACSGGRGPSAFVRPEGSGVGLDRHDFRVFTLFKEPRVAFLRSLDARCELMVARGLFTETLALILDHGLPRDSSVAEAIGYAQVIDLFGELHDRWWEVPEFGDRVRLFRAFLKDFQARTRQLTRKQGRWFSGRPFQWVDVGDRGAARRMAEAVALDEHAYAALDDWMPPRLTQKDREGLRRYSAKLTVFRERSEMAAFVDQVCGLVEARCDQDGEDVVMGRLDAFFHASS